MEVTVPMILGLVLIALGGLSVLAGELVGVFSPNTNDTITEWLTARWWTLALTLAGIGALTWHLIVSYF